MSRTWGILLVFLGACSYGILSTFVKKAYGEGYGLGDVAGTQAFFGMIFLWIVYHAVKRAAPQSMRAFPRRTAVWKILLGGAMTGIGTLFYYECVKYLPASIAIILLMQYIWISALIDWLCYRIRPGAMRIVCIAFILAGTVLATGALGQQMDSLHPRGLFFGMLAATTYALFLQVNGRLGNDYPPLQKSALMISGACVAIFIILPPAFLINGALLGGLLKYALVLSFFGTVIPPLFFATGIPRIGVALAAILSAAELPMAISFSHWMLHEQVTLVQWLGVAVILLAVVQANRTRRSAA